ncbi:hypothetical protein [Nonomuraea sp. NPDC050691]|uniref:hypothetical protein n=1 Tax=Nonomuraea sp. NPDC050691 TaxID=3155661 RepID=UPI00340C062E
MKVRGGRTLTLATVGALALSLLAVGGVATASSGGEVYACVNKKSRYARIVNATTPCRKTEIRMVIGGGTSTTTITEGTKGDTGAQGPKGDTGLQGPRGPQGLPGKNGKDGLNGKNGENGKDGKNGVDGKDGKDGLPGKDGKNGEDGKDGKPGLPGKDGKDGQDGKNGLPGKDGKDGQDGKNGLPGKDGVNGKNGEDGKDGKDGATYTSYSKSAALSGTSGSVSCATGELVTGGGFNLTPSYRPVSSMPNGNGWSVTATKANDDKDFTGGGSAGTVYVVCLKKAS